MIAGGAPAARNFGICLADHERTDALRFAPTRKLKANRTIGSLRKHPSCSAANLMRNGRVLAARGILGAREQHGSGAVAPAMRSDFFSIFHSLAGVCAKTATGLNGACAQKQRRQTQAASHGTIILRDQSGAFASCNARRLKVDPALLVRVRHPAPGHLAAPIGSAHV